MRIGISIVKSVTFRLGDQEFSNVYHFNLGTAVTAPWQSIVDEIVAMEKALHSTEVSFRRALGWSAGGTPQQNNMQHQSALSGTGSSATNSSLDRERAILIQWPAGIDSRGKPVYLRKWYHVCGNALGHAFTAAQLQQTIGLSGTTQDLFANHVNGIRQVGGGPEFWDLCSPSGRLSTGPADCHRFLEHRQLGEMWR